MATKVTPIAVSNIIFFPTIIFTSDKVFHGEKTLYSSSVTRLGDLLDFGQFLSLL